MTDTLQTAELDKILEQAFTDGASDTMWQNDRHVEIYKTAVDKAMQLIQADRAAFADRVLAVLPEKKYNNILDLKKMTTWQRMKARVWVKSHNTVVADVTTAITNLVAEERGEKR